MYFRRGNGGELRHDRNVWKETELRKTGAALLQQSRFSASCCVESGRGSCRSAALGAVVFLLNPCSFGSCCSAVVYRRLRSVTMQILF